MHIHDDDSIVVRPFHSNFETCKNVGAWEEGSLWIRSMQQLMTWLHILKQMPNLSQPQERRFLTNSLLSFYGFSSSSIWTNVVPVLRFLSFFVKLADANLDKALVIKWTWSKTFPLIFPWKHQSANDIVSLSLTTILK